VVAAICGETRGEVARHCLGWVLGDKNEGRGGSENCKGMRKRERDGEVLGED
jgi:hypothetical protein